MSDPLATAKVLREQRDEWRKKYEKELKRWDFFGGMVLGFILGCLFVLIFLTLECI